MLTLEVLGAAPESQVPTATNEVIQRRQQFQLLWSLFSAQNSGLDTHISATIPLNNKVSSIIVLVLI